MSFSQDLNDAIGNFNNASDDLRAVEASTPSGADPLDYQFSAQANLRSACWALLAVYGPEKVRRIASSPRSLNMKAAATKLHRETMQRARKSNAIAMQTARAIAG